MASFKVKPLDLDLIVLQILGSEAAPSGEQISVLQKEMKFTLKAAKALRDKFSWAIEQIEEMKEAKKDDREFDDLDESDLDDGVEKI